MRAVLPMRQSIKVIKVQVTDHNVVNVAWIHVDLRQLGCQIRRGQIIGQRKGRIQIISRRIHQYRQTRQTDIDTVHRHPRWPVK